MRIQQISVSGLFGIFDHVIPLNMGDRVTIMHGPNGFGKTVILRMINGFFKSRYSVFRNIPFSKFRVEFDNCSSVEIAKTSNNRENRDDRNKITVKFETDSNPVDFSLKRRRMDAYELNTLEDLLEAIKSTLFRVGTRKWRDRTTGEILYLADVLDRFEDFLPSEITSLEESPKWIKNLKSEIDVRLIKTERLVNFVRNRSSQSYNATGSTFPTVLAYSKEIAKLMRDKFTEYGTISQSLDRTFPVRVVKQQSSKKWTDEELRHQLNELDKTRDRLIEVGLLNKDENRDFQFQPEAIDETTRKILLVYLEDMKKKLNVFSDIEKRLSLLRRIINKKIAYSYKEMNFSKEKGFVLTSCYHPSSPSDPKKLSPTDLSSGEQHELVLFYELLFKVKPDSLVLIDEPELSLHVGWQVEFLRDLQEITKLADLDILMATHSPDIIQDRWDLTVELKGPKR
ncbi:MAG: AAA family ATPase [Hormoscilla sp. GUM202]|nr:AAA family ATPase [Hormoscilla sp. GUM202]MBO1348156.1 AAA family ATPase [Hormoscilla sp. GUM202]